MVCTEGFLAYQKRALVEILSVAVFALPPIDHGEVVEGLRHVGVVRTERLLPDRQGALVESLRLHVLASILIHEGEIVEALAHVSVARPDLGGRVVSGPVMILKGFLD